MENLERQSLHQPELEHKLSHCISEICVPFIKMKSLPIQQDKDKKSFNVSIKFSHTFKEIHTVSIF